MERFISRNKKTIALPVPLGTEIYIVRTKCGDFCMCEASPPYNEVVEDGASV